MFASLFAIALSAAAQQPAADAVLGRWQTETKGGVVEISRCGTSVCGRLVTSQKLRTNPDLKDVNNKDASLRGRPLKNMLILSGFERDGNTWEDGEIYNADDGKTYNAKLTPEGDNTLKVRGCVFVPLCKTQTWTRLR